MRKEGEGSIRLSRKARWLGLNKETEKEKKEVRLSKVQLGKIKRRRGEIREGGVM